ncbi:MAG: tetratricopeptide repeat protein [Anaerolineales bacterium]|nr:tetratricopeptide repeat protein [Anaerolineales bacterium]
MWLLEIYGHLGDEIAIAELRPAAEIEAQRWNLPYLWAILHRGYGAFCTEQGDWTEAEAAFKRALTVTRRKGLWYQDARTWLDYGRMLIRRNHSGDAELARDFLNEAQTMFMTFGAHALAEKAWIETARLTV